LGPQCGRENVCANARDDCYGSGYGNNICRYICTHSTVNWLICKVPPSHFRSKGPLGSAPVKFIPPVPVADPTTNGLGKEAEEPQRNGTSKTDVEENPYFRIDSKPTPVKGYAPQKRGDHSPGDTPTNAKRAKTEHDGPLLEKNFIEFEDISGEVDLRMLEKEKKREARKERKRKRESGASAEAAPTSNYAGGRHRQQKKKLKGISNNTDGEVNLKKRGQEAISEGGPPPFKKRKKGKKKGKGKA
jgi:hypothetical protein